MNFKHPELIILFSLIPLIFFFLIWSLKESQKNILSFCIKERVAEIFPNFKIPYYLFKIILVTLCCLFLIISIVSPRWESEIKNIEKTGSNIFIAIDVSKSMLANDISPNRLFRAKLEAIKLIESLNGDKAGIIVFAGTSFLQSPLTHDYSMLKEWLTQLDVDSITSEGTSIKSAIETAIKGFSFVNGKEKFLIIISDGEEQDEKTLEIAAQAKAADIKIISIGIGTKLGAALEYNGELIKDKNGNIVISKLDEKLLRKIAEISGGKYFSSETKIFDLKRIYLSFIKNPETKNITQSSKIERWKETYQIFLSIALIFLILDSFSSIFRKFFSSNSSIFQEIPKTKDSLKKSILIFILISCSHNPVEAFIHPAILKGDLNLNNSKYTEAKTAYLEALNDNPRNPRLNYNLGISLYKEKKYSSAENLFRKSISLNHKNDNLKEKAYYNLGNSFFKQKDYRKAINAYKAALKINPQDRDAIFNLKLAEKLLEDEENKKKNPPEKKEKNSEKDKAQEEKKEEEEKENKTEKNNPEEEKKENEDKLSKEELENLLMQVQEADPKKYSKGSPKKGSKSNNLNPW